MESPEYLVAPLCALAAAAVALLRRRVPAPEIEP
jgi:hypothetical protein